MAEVNQEEALPTVISRPHDTGRPPLVLAFQGGDVPLPKPTRADLMLSAKQWMQRLRDELFDAGIVESRNGAQVVTPAKRIHATMRRLDAVLFELEAMCRE